MYPYYLGIGYNFVLEKNRNFLLMICIILGNSWASFTWLLTIFFKAITHNVDHKSPLTVCKRINNSCYLNSDWNFRGPTTACELFFRQSLRKRWILNPTNTVARLLLFSNRQLVVRFWPFRILFCYLKTWN